MHSNDLLGRQPFTEQASKRAKQTNPYPAYSKFLVFLCLESPKSNNNLPIFDPASTSKIHVHRHGGLVMVVMRSRQTVPAYDLHASTNALTKQTAINFSKTISNNKIDTSNFQTSNQMQDLHFHTSAFQALHLLTQIISHNSSSDLFLEFKSTRCSSTQAI